MSVFNGGSHPRDVTIPNGAVGQKARRRRNHLALMLLVLAIGAAVMLAFALALSLMEAYG